jgi:hypothetical protein
MRAGNEQKQIGINAMVRHLFMRTFLVLHILLPSTTCSLKGLLFVQKGYDVFVATAIIVLYNRLMHVVLQEFAL